MDEQQREEQIRQQLTPEQIAEYVAKVTAINPAERRFLIQPLMAFFESVNELRDDQKLHLLTLHEYYHALGELDDALTSLAHERQRANTFESLLRSAEQDHHKSCIGCGVPFHAVLIGTGRHTDDCPVVAALTATEEAMDDGH